MSKIFKLLSIFGILILTACGGGGSGSTTTTSTTPTTITPPSTNFSLPSKISPVSTSSTTGTNKVGLHSKLFALRAAATDAGTDYSNAEKVTYVDEHALDQFKIISQVLNALAQTHYNDDEVSGKGAYRAMVAWQDEEGGIKRKTLEEWVVDSEIIDETGTTPRHRRVRAWIGEIKAEFKIFTPASKNADGSYKNFGTWNMNVKLDATGTSFFSAESSLGTNGESIIKIHEKNNEGGGFNHEVRAILHKTDTGGFGQVSYPNWDACITPNCNPTAITTTYAYDANHIAVKVGLNPSDPIQFKNRNAPIEMVHRYGIYDSLTGEDILKGKNFGFPVEYNLPNDPITYHAYYGAWQGRHELWGEAGPVPVGTEVTRVDFLPGQTAPKYKVAAPIRGTLSKRTISPVSLDDLKGIPFEVWTNQTFLIQWDANTTAWQDCVDPVFNPGAPATCPTAAPFDHFLDLVMLPGDYRRFVGIHREGDLSDYVIDATIGAEVFYPAEFDINGALVPKQGAAALVPGPKEELWIDISGSIFVQKVDDIISNTGWRQRELASFDQRTFSPIFKETTTVLKWSPDPDREYYINNNGETYILKRTQGQNGGLDLDEVWIETQTVANPINAINLFPDGTILKHHFEPFGAGTTSTYKFIASPKTDPNFFKLVYVTVGTEDQNLGVQIGDVVTTSLWGLGAFVGGASNIGEFNWDYPPEGETWGLMTYLQETTGTMDYVLLADPIRFNPVELTTRGGTTHTLDLQYDGWLHGIPDLFDDLMRNNFVFDTFLSNKIINIPDLTLLTDTSGKGYVVKQLEVSQFLQPLTGTSALTLADADTVNLNSVPVFVEHNMETIPDVTGVKYSEGVLVVVPAP